MIKKYLKKIIPNPSKLKQDKSLKLLGSWLHEPNIWHLNRNSVARAFSVGLFYAFVPVPFQMLLAAFTAILVRANFALSVALVWVTNPVTMPAIFYFAYKLGSWVLDTPKQAHFIMSMDSVLEHIGLIWPPFLLGCFILSVSTAIFSNLSIRLLWHLLLIRKAALRKNARMRRESKK